MRETTELLEDSLDRMLRWIQAADSKIPPILVVDTAMLGTLAAFAPRADAWSWGLAFLTAVSALLLFTSLFYALWASFPRTFGPTGSLVFFGGITQLNQEEYRKAVESRDITTYTHDLLQQTYRNAEIAGEKFRHVKSSSKTMFAAFLPWVLALYLMYPLQPQ